MRSLREPSGAMTAGVNLAGSGLALAVGAADGASDALGTADVTPNGVFSC